MVYKQLYNIIKPVMEDTSAVSMVVRLTYLYEQMMKSLKREFFKVQSDRMPREYKNLNDICDSLIEVVKLVESGERRVTGTVLK